MLRRTPSYIFALFSLLALISPARALFPKACVSRENLSSKECCPIPTGLTERCGGAGRGHCVGLRPLVNDPVEVFGGDLDRFQWPTTFFNRGCQCEGNFDGADCTSCKFGWTGKNCDRRKTRTRRNILTMPKEDVDKFTTYLNKAKDTVSDYMIPTKLYRDMDEGRSPQFNEINVYDEFSWYHYYAARENLGEVEANKAVESVAFANFSHEGPALLTWHRAYLLLWEKALRQVSGDDDFAIPYWDWADDPSCSVCTDEYVGGSDASNGHAITGPFSGWRVLCHDSADLARRGELCSYDGDVSNLPLVTRNPGGGGEHPDSHLLQLPDSLYYALSVRNYDNVPKDYDHLTNSWKESPHSFRNILEGFADSENRTGLYGEDVNQLHNQVHRYMNGTMSSVPVSSNDPIFLLHHAFVDKIFEKWLRRHDVSRDEFPSKSSPTGHNRYSYLVPFYPVYTNEYFFQRSDGLGYTYDDISERGLPLDPIERDGELAALHQMGKFETFAPSTSSSNDSSVAVRAILAAVFGIVLTVGLVYIIRRRYLNKKVGYTRLTSSNQAD